VRRITFVGTRCRVNPAQHHENDGANDQGHRKQGEAENDTAADPVDLLCVHHAPASATEHRLYAICGNQPDDFTVCVHDTAARARANARGDTRA